MIGMIITGHGRFATGIREGLNLLLGKPEKFETADYKQEDSTDDLELQLKQSLKNLSDCSGVLIMCDIAGGAPYKLACQLSDRKKDEMEIIVIGGCSLAMIMQTSMARGYLSDLSDLAEMAIDQGKKQIVCYTDEEESREEEDD